MIRLIKFILKYRKHVKAWTKINYEYGKDLGYPECCIREFCSYPPVFIRWHRVKGMALPNGKMKFDAGCIDGQYTGFIPCTNCAQKIHNKEVAVESLINNRFVLFHPFPYHGDWEGLNNMIKNKRQDDEGN